MKPVLRSLLWSAIYLSIFAMATPGEAQTYQGKELVKPELLADTTAVVPGKEFTIGLFLRMAPGWHTYWHSPGDAGLPTEVKWKLPPGWQERGGLQWPIPLKTTDPGDIQTYGYENEVLLMQQITTPAKIDNQKVTLSAEASWLVCEKICIPGSATLQLELPVGPGGAPDNSAIFSRFRRLLPHQWPKEQIAKADWSRTDSDLRLKITSAIPSKYSLVDFYPAPPPNATIGHPQIEKRNDNAVIFRIPVESPKDLSAIPGLVVLAHHPDGSDRTAWQLDLPRARAAAAMGNARGVIAFLFFGFLGGFILNLMPCVLPVISLKIFGFIQQAGQSRRKIFRSGIAFVAGIFAWFIGLALVLIGLKAAGRDVTWGGFQFTNAYFVLVLSVVVLVFALNLFGVFEISLPQAATRGLLGWSAGEGELGSFFQGVFATVLATPCSAPFLGTALGFAFAQSAPVILLMFVAIAAGMGAPYLLLSAQPAWLRFLPKPGPWMLRVKEAMGFLLLATLLFLLYVLGAQRGLAGAIWASCFLLAVGVACWMKGAFLTPNASATARVIAAVTMSILLVLSGVYFIGKQFRSAQADREAMLSGDWQPFTPQRLQAELDQDHAVFVDFTAAWCLTCKFNERSVLENAAVRDAFQTHGVIKLKADWTNGDPTITKLLQQFGRPGVPLYVLYPGRSGQPIVFPELLTKNMLLEKLGTLPPTVAAK
ncbi:MAG TPA: protein-disulfide reductase DsbD domain-containing protein [Chthoniobacterales bacterium]|jgi:thiol:disulfide interchange protein DsbD